MTRSRLATPAALTLCQILLGLLAATSTQATSLGPIDRLAVGPSAGWMEGRDAQGEIGLGLSGVALLSDHWAIQGDVFRFPSMNIQPGEIEMIPATLTLQYRYPHQGITYFAGVGGGYYFMDSSLSARDLFGSEIADALQGTGFSTRTEVDDEFGYHIEAGTDISLLEHLTAQFAVRYTFVETDIAFDTDAIVLQTDAGPTAVRAQGKDTLDLGGIGLFITLRYSF